MASLQDFRYTHNHSPKHMKRASKLCNYHMHVFHKPKPAEVQARTLYNNDIEPQHLCKKLEQCYNKEGIEDYVIM